MSGAHEVESLVRQSMESLRRMMDVNMVVGDIIETTDGIAIIPVSKTSCGFFAGCGEYGQKKENLPFAGGSGAGFSVSPVGFLVVCGDTVRLIPVSGSTNVDKAIDAIPMAAGELRKFLQQGKDATAEA